MADVRHAPLFRKGFRAGISATVRGDVKFKTRKRLRKAGAIVRRKRKRR